MSKILIIDKDDDYENIYLHHLLSQGHSVLCVRDGAITRKSGFLGLGVSYDCLDWLSYDVAIVDIESNGVEFIDFVKGLDGDVNIIVLSRNYTYENVKNAINSGVVFYWFDKDDFNLDLFLETVKDACRVIPERLTRKWLKAIY